MSVFYLGVGANDVGNTMSFLGVPGGSTFRNVFYNNLDEFTHKITKELDLIVEEGLQQEIASTIEYQLGGKFTDVEIKDYVTKFKENSGSLPSSITRIKIVGSYDMG